MKRNAGRCFDCNVTLSAESGRDFLCENCEAYHKAKSRGEEPICQRDALAVRVSALEAHIKTLSDRHTRLVERSFASTPGGDTEVLAFRLQLLEQRVQHLQEFVANVSEHCNLVGDAFTMREWVAFPSVEDYLELEEHIRGALS